MTSSLLEKTVVDAIAVWIARIWEIYAMSIWIATRFPIWNNSTKTQDDALLIIMKYPTSSCTVNGSESRFCYDNNPPDVKNIRIFYISAGMSLRYGFIIFIFHDTSCLSDPYGHCECECGLEWNVCLHLVKQLVAWKMSIHTLGQLLMDLELYAKRDFYGSTWVDNLEYSQDKVAKNMVR